MNRYHKETPLSRISPMNRREFIAALFAAPLLSNTLTAKADNISVHEHFYCADLKRGTVVLPKEHLIDKGKPGSLMKLIAATAILEENLPASIQAVDCRGSIIVAGQRYICRYPHGRLTLTEAIGQSCNVFFAHSSTQLNSQCFLHYLKKFGLGSTDSSKLARHSTESSIDLILGLADGFELSAMQILQMITSIATRGKLTQLCAHDNAKQNIVIPGVILHEHTWDVLNTGMQIACERGTAKKLDPQNKLHLAAKTGTTIHGKTFQSWLAGYFPYESPRYSFCLRAKVGTSYDQAVPIAREILFSKSWTDGIAGAGA